jgi:predicted metal-binding membrane protein
MTTAANSSLPARERAVIWSALAALTALSWVYLFLMPMRPADLGAIGVRFASMMPAGWAEAWLIFLMWAVMMVAMMLPSASPMIETYARIAHDRNRGAVNVWLFALAYVFVWTIFSALATAGQIALQHAALISASLTTPPLLGAAVLLAAGIYQLTPLKQACLGHCRSPLGFFMTEWREGPLGAIRMGVKHGTFCVGCCWMLMALLFVAGVMNLAWVAAISVFVLLEKVTPWGRIVANGAGLALIVSGVALALRCLS